MKEVAQLGVPITGFLEASVAFAATGDPVKRQPVGLALHKLRLFLQLRASDSKGLHRQAFEVLVRLLTSIKRGDTQGVTAEVVGFSVLRAVATQAGTSDQILGRGQAVINGLQRVLPALPPGGFDVRTLSAGAS
jgi:hypothetical protein